MTDDSRLDDDPMRLHEYKGMMLTKFEMKLWEFQESREEKLRKEREVREADRTVNIRISEALESHLSVISSY